MERQKEEGATLQWKEYFTKVATGENKIRDDAPVKVAEDKVMASPTNVTMAEVADTMTICKFNYVNT